MILLIFLRKCTRAANLDHIAPVSSEGGRQSRPERDVTFYSLSFATLSYFAMLPTNPFALGWHFLSMLISLSVIVGRRFATQLLRYHVNLSTSSSSNAVQHSEMLLDGLAISALRARTHCNLKFRKLPSYRLRSFGFKNRRYTSRRLPTTSLNTQRSGIHAHNHYFRIVRGTRFTSAV